MGSNQAPILVIIYMNELDNKILEISNVCVLDTLVILNPHTKIFSTTLYVKPIHSRCITLWDSHGSISSKRAIVIGEVKRAIKCSTDSVSQKQSLNLITKLFVANGYPKSFIKSVTRSTLRNINRRQNDDQQQFVYLKLPFINEEFKRRALGVLNRSRIQNVKIHFMNGQPLS
jgi:hypothetical protein